jgi:riboflavin synthase
MFTGIITEIGRVKSIKSRDDLAELTVIAPETAGDFEEGESVAVNGVCLTATKVRRRRWFRADVMAETLARTTLGELDAGDEVNLELPARLADRLGGHLVQGHVDGVATVVRIESDGPARRVWYKASPRLTHYIVSKGSIAVDGVSLTVVDADTETFEVALIPHTLEETAFKDVLVGTRSNVEIDVIAKYVDKLVTPFRRADS